MSSRAPGTLRLPAAAAVDAEIASRIMRVETAAALLIARAVDEDLPEVVRFAARLEPGLRRAFLRAAANVAEAIDVEALARAMAAGRMTTEELDAALKRLPPELADAWRPILTQAFRIGARDAAAAVPPAPALSGVLTGVNADAVEWARRWTADRVVQVDAVQRAAIRELTAEAMAGRRDVWATARLIRDIVGLDPARLRTLERRRQAWLDAGVTGDALDRRTEKLAAALRHDRAKVISRTEVMTAAAQGQRLLWERSVTAGLLDPAVTRRQWMATLDDRVDPNCEELDGTTAPLLGGAFPGDVLGPPLHPRCRCTVRLIFLTGPAPKTWRDAHGVRAA